METVAAAGILYHAKKGLWGLMQTLGYLSVQMWGLDTGRLRFCDYRRVWACAHLQFLLEISSLCVELGKRLWKWHLQSPGPRLL